jgi:DNA-binding phage protein
MSRLDKTTDYYEYLLKSLQDEEEAQGYLDATIATGDIEAISHARSLISTARAQRVKLNSLEYQDFSENSENNCKKG